MLKKLGIVALSGALVFSGVNLGTADAAKPENAGKEMEMEIMGK